jgi:hypothetical protein
MGTGHTHQMSCTASTARQRFYKVGGAVTLAARLKFDKTFMHQGLYQPVGRGVGQANVAGNDGHARNAMAVDGLQNRKAAADRSNGTRSTG